VQCGGRRFDECRGFVEGVEKVLNHMVLLANEGTPGVKPTEATNGNPFGEHVGC
jgi:hypothetical protein